MPFPSLRRKSAPAAAPDPAADALATGVVASTEPAGAPTPSPAPGELSGGAPADPAAAAQVEQLTQRVSTLGDNLQSMTSVLSAMRQETSAIGQHLKDSDAKFVRLVSMLESVNDAGNPFVERGPRLPGDAVPGLPSSMPEVALPKPAPPAPAPPKAAAPAPAPLPPPPAAEAASAPGLVTLELAPHEAAPAPPPPAMERPAPAPPAPEAPFVKALPLASALPGRPTAASLKAPPRAAAPPPPEETETPTELEESVLLLEWADMLLSAVDREALGHLLDWYHGMGWLDGPLKDRLLECSRGIEAAGDDHAPSRPEGSDPPLQGRTMQGAATWRQDLDLHLRSLAFAARLRRSPLADPERLEEVIRDAVAIRTR